LAPSFGRGAMTNNWIDIKNANVILVMGGNSAEAHPVGFKWVIEAKARNKAKLIVVDPRFNRTAAVADLYVPLRAGTDIAFLGGVINYLLTKDAIHHEYVKAFTNASFIVKDGFSFSEGLFSGYDSDKREYDRSTWEYELGPDGYVQVDETLQHPRCVFQLMKQHYSRYTPEVVANITGSPKDKFLEVCELIASTAAPNRTMTSMYALGWTNHSVGTQNIRCMAMIQLLLGNIGMSGGGLNALRGHSNIQGLTDLGLLSNLMPGYLTLPAAGEPDLASYLAKRTPKPLRPGQLNYWSNYPKFFVSLMKALYGPAATKENEYGYRWLPKLDKVDHEYDMLRVQDLMAQGKMNGYICQGFNPLQASPNKAKTLAGLSKLKYLVVIDPLATETSAFFENHGEYNPVDSSKIMTEVFRLPSICFAEDEGSLVNSSRWLQWHYRGQDPPGEARTDIDIIAALFLRIRELYRKEGGVFPEPILNLHWPYLIPERPTPAELARELNGYALADVKDPQDPTKVLVKAGQQLATFAQLRDDGSTACGCWIYSGCWTEKGNQMARRDTHDPGDRGLVPGWAFSWPANRRILYNRASCDPNGKPWDPNRPLIHWNGTKWVGIDVPDYVPTADPSKGMGPFIMHPEGVGRLFSRVYVKDGPFPEHYEPFETPLGTNPLHPKVVTNPVARLYKDDHEELGDSSKFPYVGTTYRLTELFHYWSKHCLINAILQPQQFVEISEQLAAEKGIANGSEVIVTSARGRIRAVAVVTKRMKPLTVNGKVIQHVGIPIHWGFTGLTRKGFPANVLTPCVGDANTQTPETKAFLVNVERA
jgi:formate dehydrogenase major subunit